MSPYDFCAGRYAVRTSPCFIGVVWLLLGATATFAADEQVTRVLQPGQHPKDSRLGKPKELNGYFPLTVPADRARWEARRREVREQVLVATGLWPMPDRPAVEAIIHGKIDRDDYTIEKVYFASYPGHYVSGNLYRPKNKTGKLPGVLCPHGHWRNGRFYDAGEQDALNQIKMAAEKTIEGARYPLQARCAQLARMGCVVFHYDMVGVADSQPIAHTTGFTDAEAELRLQSFMGLQTFNSIRALDFLAAQPEVDPERLGVTGASGGGTQTFMLCAIDDRPAAAFPAVMVSTAMQGGCICENCSYLRQDTGNIELAGLFAPRPFGMSGANDWTIDIETKGLPELKALYRLYGAEDRVMAKCFPQFPHNYNQVSREVMYNWFNKHLRLGQPKPVQEKPFVAVDPKELSVFDEQHPRPSDALDAVGLRKNITAIAERQLGALRPTDGKSLEPYRSAVGTALRVMVGDRLPGPADVDAKKVKTEARDNLRLEKWILGRKEKSEEIPAVLLVPSDAKAMVVVWVHPDGKASLFRDGKLVAAAQHILDAKASILAADLFLTGEFLPVTAPAVDARYAGYTFGYNRPLLANRVHDLLTVIAFAASRPEIKSVDLVGFDKAGVWTLLARGLCGDKVRRSAVHADFDFDQVHSTSDEMMLPGAVKYGGIAGLAALCAPQELLIHGLGKRSLPLTEVAYRAASQSDRLDMREPALSSEDAVRWLLR
jgi:dienelactone hydrolase